MSQHVADTTQNVAIWATKTTRRHPTYGAKLTRGGYNPPEQKKTRQKQANWWDSTGN